MKTVIKGHKQRHNNGDASAKVAAAAALRAKRSLAKSVLSAHLNAAPQYIIAHPDQTIFFVATAQDWKQCEQHLATASVVGLDTERKPDFSGKKRRSPCSLLQIATRRRSDNVEAVFLLDLLHLEPKLYNAALAKMFLSKRILKLGQDFGNDLKELAESYPSATCFTVAKAVVEVNDLSIKLVGAHQRLSLQKLVFLYLHKKLTKSQQTSNWNRRPLAPGQLHYAACDALVLLHLYDVLKAKLGRTFSVETVKHVLDVFVTAAPMCGLCLVPFATLQELQTHRRECGQNIRLLHVCDQCHIANIWNAEQADAHVDQCECSVSEKDVDNNNEENTEPASNVVAVSTTITTTKTLLKRKDKKLGVLPRSKRARKMSEGSLWAADDIWREISESQDSASDDPTS